MGEVLNSEDGLNDRIYKFPTSAILEGGKKISYFEYISSLKNEDLNKALRNVASRIDMEAICKFIDSVPVIEEVQKDFYKIMIAERKEKIIDYSMELLMANETNSHEIGGMTEMGM